MNQKEIWKEVVGYEGSYQISSFGRVKSLSRVIVKGNGVECPFKERMIKPYLGNRGYFVAGLSENGKTKPKKIHQLVAMAFLDHKPDGKQTIVVDHIDNNKMNNNVNNLQLISQRENTSKDQKGGSSSFVGVNWHKNASKWVAKISVNGKRKHLGYFTNELDASKAYQTALKDLVLANRID